MTARAGAPAALALLLLAALTAPSAAQYQPLVPRDFGDLEPRTDLAAAGETAGALRVLRFALVGDAHVLDDDAPPPLRSEALDPVGPPFEAAQRPHEESTDEVLDATVRAINALHAADALDLVLHVGDGVDNALENELMRFLDVWEGTHTTTGPVSGRECVPDGQSAGVDDDGSDVTDRCTSLPAALAANNTPLAPGLPWFTAVGEHDVRVQGDAPVAAGAQEMAAQSGRYFLSPAEFVGMHFAAGGGCVAGRPAGSVLDDNGHGFGYAGQRLCDDDPDNDGYYAFTLRGVRFIVLDTVNDDLASAGVGGSADGAVDAEQFDWLMDEVTADSGRLVVVVGHHPVDAMSPVGGCAEGPCPADLLAQAGYKTGPALVEALSAYPNVVAWFGGHTHQHRVQPKTVEGAASPGFWSVETGSLVDLPQQGRVVELWVTADGDKAFWTLQRFDHDLEAVRSLAATDAQHDAQAAAGTPQDQDVLLWFDLPAGASPVPQPSLERELRVRMVAPEPVGGFHGVPDEPLTLVFQVTDPLLGAPATGLVGEASVRRLGGDGASTVLELDAAPMTEGPDGRYAVDFTPRVGGTHFLDLHLEDPGGTYDPVDRTISFRMRPPPEETVDEAESPGFAVAVAALALLAVAARARRR